MKARLFARRFIDLLCSITFTREVVVYSAFNPKIFKHIKGFDTFSMYGEGKICCWIGANFSNTVIVTECIAKLCICSKCNSTTYHYHCVYGAAVVLLVKHIDMLFIWSFAAVRVALFNFSLVRQTVRPW